MERRVHRRRAYSEDVKGAARRHCTQRKGGNLGIPDEAGSVHPCPLTRRRGNCSGDYPGYGPNERDHRDVEYSPGVHGAGSVQRPSEPQRVHSPQGAQDPGEDEGVHSQNDEFEQL